MEEQSVEDYEMIRFCSGIGQPLKDKYMETCKEVYA